MGRNGAPRLAGLCLNRVRARPPLIRPGQAPPEKAAEKGGDSGLEEARKTSSIPATAGAGQKIMVVVDWSSEAKSALHWALSNSVHSQDTLILLHVCRPFIKQGDKECKAKGEELLQSMKSTCQMKRPEVHVEVSLVEGKEKGPTVVEAARVQGISLLILGHRRRSMVWSLLMAWARNRPLAGGIADYCIENAGCMTLAVRKKSKKLGGYLITTKRHKDFWLLA